MNVAFTMLDSEADTIASQYAHDPFKDGTTRDAFVLEVFKKFGRDIIISKRTQDFVKAEEIAKAAAISDEISKISF